MASIVSEFSPSQDLVGYHNTQERKGATFPIIKLVRTTAQHSTSPCLAMIGRDCSLIISALQVQPDPYEYPCNTSQVE